MGRFGDFSPVKVEQEISAISWYRSLQFKILLIFFVLILGTGSGVTMLAERNAGEISLQQTREFSNSEAVSVANQLGQRIIYSEVMVAVVQGIVQTIPTSLETLKFVLPTLLEPDDPDSIIAGGGIWPEPFTLNPEAERSGLFVTRNEQGQLEYREDVNDEVIESYHRQEWYLAAKYHSSANVYWSRAYIDPVTRLPIATVAIPYRGNSGEIEGVVSLDIKISDLAETFRSQAGEWGGYMYLVDKAGGLIVPPADASAHLMAANRRDLPQLTSFFPLNESLKPAAEILESHWEQRLQQARQSDAVRALATQLRNESAVFDENFALSVAQGALESSDSVRQWDLPRILGGFEVDESQWLQQQEVNSIVEVPSSNWVVVVAVPRPEFPLLEQLSESNLFLSLFAFAAVVLLLATITTHQVLVTPIVRLARQLRKIDRNPESDRPLWHPNEDELGLLADGFNDRAAALEESRRKAEYALQMKKDFLANMSHEIRTPMNGILLSSELLTEDCVDDDSRSYAEMIQVSAKALLVIINDILDYAKIESGKFSIELAPFDLHRSVVDVFKLFEPEADLKNLDYELLVDPRVARAYEGDVARIRQILLNLLGNAIKFTDSGFVRLHVTAEDEETVRFRIEDSGIGIKPGQLDSIFDEFSQADTSITRNFGGTGLGLSISRQLAHVMGGGISVKSEFGVGSSFDLSLPLKKILDFREVGSSELKSNADGEDSFHVMGKRALLVDDHEVNCILGRKLLVQLGFDVTVVSDGLQAINAVAKEEFDIVLMDIQMPVLDGISASRKIRSLDLVNRNVPIIAVSANVSAGVTKECEDAGMNGYVSKPLRKSILIEELSHHIVTMPPTYNRPSTEITEAMRAG